MSDFTIMRQNMVKGQILPENVTHSLVINAFSNVPREKFVPRQLAHIAYMDTNFSFSKGRFLLRPATLARLLEALNPLSSDKILYIAAGTGYGAALLGESGIRVVALDSEEALTQEAERLIQDLKLSSIKVVLGPLTEGWEKEAPYDKIIIEGSIENFPESLSFQLKEGGTMVTCKHHKEGRMEAIKYIKKQGVITEISLFDAFAPRLKAFRKRKGFVF